MVYSVNNQINHHNIIYLLTKFPQLQEYTLLMQMMFLNRTELRQHLQIQDQDFEKSWNKIHQL